MPLSPLIGRDNGPDRTASVTPLAAPQPSTAIVAAPLPPPGSDKPAPTNAVAEAFAGREHGPSFSPTDWVYARGALGLALSGDAGGPPVPWANPDTGTHGNFAPAAPTASVNGATCRDFVARRVAIGREEHLAGRACKSAAGAWDIAEIRAEPATL